MLCAGLGAHDRCGVGVPDDHEFVFRGCIAHHVGQLLHDGLRIGAQCIAARLE